MTSSNLEPTVKYDILSPAFAKNPHSTLHAMREQDPVFWHPLLHSWVLTRYADMVRVLRDGGSRGQEQREREQREREQQREREPQLGAARPAAGDQRLAGIAVGQFEHEAGVIVHAAAEAAREGDALHVDAAAPQFLVAHLEMVECGPERELAVGNEFAHRGGGPFRRAGNAEEFHHQIVGLARQRRRGVERGLLEKAIGDLGNRIVSANAYMGGVPIAEALAQGADIVVTGRVAPRSTR